MSTYISAQVAIDAAVKATENYADIITDRDPADGEHVVPGELRRFLARLRLLHGVPFSYLVPDSDLLPIESIRFFYIDRAWTDALVQGALSVGTISSADRAQLAAVYPHIQQEVDVAERSIRQPQGEELLAGAGGTITGFLLRSRAVSGWPNLHVRAYSRDLLPDDALTTAAESDPDRMKVLRMERLAPAVLMVLIDGVPAVVHIEEPRQGIQFGVRLDPEDPPAQRRGKVHVRDNATGESVPPKDDFTTANSVKVPFRPGAPGVINVSALRDRLAAKAPNSGGSLEPNEYALQMLRFPYRQVFGDPKDTEGLRFYDLDKFKVTLALPQWKQQVIDNLNMDST
ncbi:hypothetical protein [Piscinibacter sp.]|jgi:hypothetical protein|uniref:hypothetical protein n=1 Tax=Piscinibacter sp. TaxID=1903157 RepID=UPI00355988DD